MKAIIYLCEFAFFVWALYKTLEWMYQAAAVMENLPHR